MWTRRRDVALVVPRLQGTAETVMYNGQRNSRVATKPTKPPTKPFVLLAVLLFCC
jgi:hypothetical protein